MTMPPINADELRNDVIAFTSRIATFNATMQNRVADLTRVTPTQEATLFQVHEEITTRFHRLMAHMNVLTEVGVPCRDEFIRRAVQITGYYEASERALAAYKATLVPGAEPTPVLQTPASDARLLYIPVTVFYSGKGQLFIRGMGAAIAPPPCAGAGRTTPPIGENLRWEEGVVLPRIADHIYQTTLAVPEGTRAEYKITCWDNFCSGENYSTDGSSPAIHIPCFKDARAPQDRQPSTLAIPLNVGYGHKLAIAGQGLISIGSQWVPLSWENPYELTCLKSDLWGTEIILREPGAKHLEYKIVLIKEDGSIVKWEEGPNRKLVPGTEHVLHPNLGIAQGDRSAVLDFVNTSQVEMLASMGEEHWQAEAAKAARARPCLRTDGSIFRDGDIFKVHDVAEIKPMTLDGEEFFISYNEKGRSIVMQQALNGCTAGTAAMLIIDNGGRPSRAALTTRTAAIYTVPAEDIANAGLTSVLTPVTDLHNSLRELRNLILLHGSAIVDIKETNTHGVSHVVVVDEIAADLATVRLRDPWHNWDVTVEGGAFATWWKNRCDTNPEGRIIQVRKP